MNSVEASEKYYTSAAFPVDERVFTLFRKQAAEHPERIALQCADRKMTYAQLDRQSDLVACRLIEMGIQKEEIIAIMMEASFELIIAMLGVMKAGGAYLVVDAEYPESRIEYMLDNCKVNIMIIGAEGYSVQRFDGRTVRMESLLEEKASDMSKVTDLQSDSSSLVYVLYTSGTTGNPKALMEEHRNLINVVYHLHTILGDEGTRDVLQFFSPSFTVSYQEIFVTLLFGGTYHVIDSRTRNNIGKLFEYITEYKIVTAFFPTAYLRIIAKEQRYYTKIPESVANILAAGDKLIITREFLEYIKEKHITLYNNYGISEVNMTTIYPVPYDTKNLDNLPVGTPVSNVYVYILDKDREICDVGQWGELYIAGAGVCRGYYNNQEMTEKSFLDDPFHSGRMYKSGDVGMWNERGEVLVQGRIDLQANIKGYRVETGEIEYQLMQCPSVTESAVVVRKLDDMDELCAFLVSEEKDAEAVSRFLEARIPSYMLPKQIVFLKELPKLPAGKVDRALLSNYCFEMETGKTGNEEQEEQEDLYLQKIRDVIAQVTENEIKTKLDLNEKLETYGLDSLNFLRLVVCMEEAFEIEFDEDHLELKQFEKVGDLTDYIKGRGCEKS